MIEVSSFDCSCSHCSSSELELEEESESDDLVGQNRLKPKCQWVLFWLNPVLEKFWVGITELF